MLEQQPERSESPNIRGRGPISNWQKNSKRTLKLNKGAKNSQNINEDYPIASEHAFGSESAQSQGGRSSKPGSYTSRVDKGSSRNNQLPPYVPGEDLRKPLKRPSNSKKGN